MYVGSWLIDKKYIRGEIIYHNIKKQYFICNKDHISSELDRSLSNFNKSDYWIYLDSNFLNNYVIHNVSSGMLFNSDKLQINISDKLLQKGINSKLDDKFTEDEDFFDIKLSDINNMNNKLYLKRKIRSIEQSITEYKKKKHKDDSYLNIREKLLLLDIDIVSKSYLLDKYDSAKHMSGGDYSKSMNWFKNVINIPYGKYALGLGNTEGKINKKANVKNLLNEVINKLDEYIYGMDDVKQEILEYVARRITNPSGKGDVLALCGKAGVGKTKIIKCLAHALNLPFFQINCGGLNDVAVLTGHSETYVGSRPGKIVEILQNSSVMNPIIYLDEIDKISENKSAEINGILTHLLDEEQNNKFQDNYLSNITIDLSKVLFVISFNDESKITKITKYKR